MRSDLADQILSSLGSLGQRLQPEAIRHGEDRYRCPGFDSDIDRNFEEQLSASRPSGVLLVDPRGRGGHSHRSLQERQSEQDLP